MLFVNFAPPNEKEYLILQWYYSAMICQQAWSLQQVVSQFY